MHRFDHEDAMASAWVERDAYPKSWTSVEGGDIRIMHGRRFDHRQPVHALFFSDQREWDEHNGWRAYARIGVV